jgi:hypothetical protein
MDCFLPFLGRVKLRIAKDGPSARPIPFTSEKELVGTFKAHGCGQPTKTQKPKGKI